MNRLIAWIRSFFQRTEVKHFNDRKRRKTKRHSAEHFGAHYYLGDLLDSLDSAFNCLGVFKRNDPIHYKMFSRVGCSIMSKDAFAWKNIKKLNEKDCLAHYQKTNCRQS